MLGQFFTNDEIEAANKNIIQRARMLQTGQLAKALEDTGGSYGCEKCAFDPTNPKILYRTTFIKGPFTWATISGYKMIKPGEWEWEGPGEAPDPGTPKAGSDVLSFIKRVRSAQKPDSGDATQNIRKIATISGAIVITMIVLKIVLGLLKKKK